MDPDGIDLDLLTDATRRRIVGLLALQPRRAAPLAVAAGLSVATARRHLGLLVTGGLVRAVRSPVLQRSLRYGLEPTVHGSITAWLAGVDPNVASARETAPESNGASADRAEAPSGLGGA